MRSPSRRRYVAAVRHNKLLLAQGPASLELLRGSPRPAALGGAPIRTATLKATAGADALVLLDFVSTMVRVFQNLTQPELNQLRIMLGALPGLSSLRAPIVFAAHSGPTLRYELQIPTGTLDNIAKVIRPFMGVMGPSRPSPN